MNKKGETRVNLDFGIGGLLGVVFITLKLCGVIDWSWWWVTCPFWIPLIFAAIFLLII
jgi:hypothetical protein